MKDERSITGAHEILYENTVYKLWVPVISFKYNVNLKEKITEEWLYYDSVLYRVEKNVSEFIKYSKNIIVIK